LNAKRHCDISLVFNPRFSIFHLQLILFFHSYPVLAPFPNRPRGFLRPDPLSTALDNPERADYHAWQVTILMTISCSNADREQKELPMVPTGRNTSRYSLLVSIQILLLLAVAPAPGQVPITQNDLLSVMGPGVIQYLALPDSTVSSANIGSPGGPHLYDFSGVNFMPTLTRKNLLVDSIPLLATRFPAGSITYGTSADSLEVSPVLRFTTDTLFQVGNATTLAGYRFRHFVPNSVFMPLPLTYHASFSRGSTYFDTTFNGAWQVTKTYQTYQPAVSFVDGYGSLKVLGHTVSCLRVKTVYTNTNEMEILFAGSGGLLVVLNMATASPDSGVVPVEEFGVLSATNLTDVEGPHQTPAEFRLEQNYPNPFNPATTIAFEIPTASPVRLTIVDILGREVRVLVDETKQPGYYEVQFNASRLASGVYLYRLHTGSSMLTRKLCLIR
jgi:hypothetical protein